MQKALTIGLLNALALALSWLFVFSHLSAPALQILWIPLLALVAFLLFLLALLARLSQPVPASALAAGTGTGTGRTGRGHSWASLGLVAGGVIGLYWAGIYALDALYPVPPLMAGILRYRPDSVGLLSLLVLAGAVGAIGSSSSGALGTGVRASLLAIAVGYVLSLASEVLLIALVWTALQRGQVHSQLEGDYQTWYGYWVQELGQADTAFQFTFNSPYGLQPFGVLFGGLLNMLVGAPFATLGGALSIATRRRVATRRTHDAQRQALATAAPDSDRPPPARSVRVVGLTLAVLALGVLAWGFYAVLGGPYPLSLHDVSDVSSLYAGPAFFAWLLALVVVLVVVHVSVLVSARSVRSVRPPTSSAGGGAESMSERWRLWAIRRTQRAVRAYEHRPRELGGAPLPQRGQPFDKRRFSARIFAACTSGGEALAAAATVRGDHAVRVWSSAGLDNVDEPFDLIGDAMKVQA